MPILFDTRCLHTKVLGRKIRVNFKILTPSRHFLRSERKIVSTMLLKNVQVFPVFRIARIHGLTEEGGKGYFAPATNLKGGTVMRKEEEI